MARTRLCAYCGAATDLTDDHIPPKNLFPKPRPHNLITVYACRKCHAGTSKDDEYFRQNVSLTQEAGSHPEARKNWETIFRSMHNPKAPGLRKSFLGAMKDVSVMSPGGIYLGNTIGYHVDLERIFRVIQRTVRGLFFHETKRRLPDDYEVTVYSNESFQGLGADAVEDIRRTVLVPLAAMEAKVIGQDVFRYRFQVVSDQHANATSAWALTFYGAVSFVALTTRSNEARPDSPASV